MKKQIGVTLIEVILVLAIAVTLIVLSFRIYQSYRVDADIDQFNTDLDTLFQSMSGFYNANCDGTFDASTTPPTPKGGQLFMAAVSNTTAPYPPFPLSTNTLISNGFLSAQPLVNPFASNYILQFNEYPQPKYICTDASDCQNNQQQVGTIINWKIQIAVLMSDPTQIEEYQKILAADCISDVDSTTPTQDTVTPCANSKKTGNYLVFERTPAASAPLITSGLELMTPVLKQFKQMYTTQPVTNLTGGNNQYQYQYYNCGT